MYTVIKADSPRQKRAFFSLSRESGYGRAEDEYLRLYCRPENACWLMAARNGFPKARMLVWMDGVYAKKTGRRVAFFAFLDGEAAAFDVLLEKAQGLYPHAQAILGPVPPDGSGLFTGQCDRPWPAPRGSFTGPGDAGQTEALLRAGFAPHHTEACFEVDIPDRSPYHPYAKRLSDRFGIRIRRPGFGPFGDGMSTAAYDLASAYRDETAFQAQKLHKYISARHSFIAEGAAGETLGYIMTLKGKPLLRVTTMITKAVPFRSAVTLLLLDALYESLACRQIQRVEASVINVMNRPSIRLVLGTGAKENRRYIQYYKELT